MTEKIGTPLDGQLRSTLSSQSVRFEILVIVIYLIFVICYLKIQNLVAVLV